MSQTSYDDFFAVLSGKQRIRIIRLLDAQGPKNVSQIAQELQLEQSAVSHCVKQLLNFHFVDVRPLGKERVYEINKDTIKPLFRLINKHMDKYCVKGCDHAAND